MTPSFPPSPLRVRAVFKGGKEVYTSKRGFPGEQEFKATLKQHGAVEEPRIKEE
jgi:hypothetical protein